MVDSGQPPFVRLAAHPLRWQLLTCLAGSDCRVRELVDLVQQPQNLVSYHLRLLRDGGLVTATRSSFDGRDTYYHLDVDQCAAGLELTGAALHPSLRRQPVRRQPAPPPSKRPIAVLFICTGNSARSPIAEALLRARSGGGVRAASAGTHPTQRLHPNAERVLREEFDIDVSHQRPRPLGTLTGTRFDHVITLCDKARETVADRAESRRAHWSVPDPADAGYDFFRTTAREIDTRVRHLLPALADQEV